MGLFKAYERDENLEPIRGGSCLHTDTLSVDDTSWTALVVPSTINIKGFFIKSRGDYDIKLSTQDDGSAYITIGTSGKGIDLAKLAGENLGYIQSANVTDTIEILYWY